MHQSLCIDGSRPKLMNVQLDGGLKTYELRCDDASWTNTSIDSRGLDKRQAAAMCGTACNSHCYFPADYNPEPGDCARIAENLRTRQSSWNVPIGGTNVVEFNTCIFTFTNQGRSAMSYCDADWSVIGNSLATTCVSWGANPAKGGICTNSNFYIKAIRTENMPMLPSSGAPPSSLASTSPPSSSSPSSSPLSSSQPSGSTTNTRTTTDTGISRSTAVSYETPGGFSDGLVETNSLVPSGSISASTGSSQSHRPRNIDIAAIVGGTIGGVAGVAFLLGVFFIFRRVRSYEELQSLQVDSYPVSHSRPTFTNSDATIPTSDAPMVEIDSASRGSALMPCEFGSTPSQQKPVKTALPGVEVPAPTVEALIAAAALPGMSREQIDLFAANFVSLVRGRQVLDEEPEDEVASEIRQPPPYQQQ
ncbi:SubName: Full=Uncharacterized protein {ECO:0000313/EMBL:CCA72303.1} [Serendipita indica DSM 11827]|nr:SubName: Full=Uncharacterized protein {ECO:0000313/EMBL:CCA72303.1} [Serendipita indica DSM 11827]